MEKSDSQKESDMTTAIEHKDPEADRDRSRWKAESDEEDDILRMLDVTPSSMQAAMLKPPAQ
jgi:hypothetical protein